MRVSFKVFLVSITAASFSVPGVSGYTVYDDFFFEDDMFGVTEAPTLSPTSVPSSQPSLSPTMLPTTSPTVSLSSAPSEEPCHVSEKGEFGSVENEHSEVIPYSYQVKYKSSGDISQILGDLETAISNSILSRTSYFKECGSKANTRHLNLGRSVVGLSSLPKDTVSSDECSSGTVSDGSECLVVNGGLSLFYGDVDSRRHLNESEEIGKVIKDAIADGSLQKANEDILDLGYIAQDTTNSVVDPSDGNDDNPTPDSNGPPAQQKIGSTNLGIIIVAACGTVALLALTAWKYRNAKLLNSHDDLYDVDVFDESSIDEPIPSYQFVERRSNVADVESEQEDISNPQVSTITTGQINDHDRYNIYPNPFMSYSEHIKSDEVNIVYENGQFKNKPSKYLKQKDVHIVPSNESFEDNNLNVLYDIALEGEDTRTSNTSTPIGCRFADSLCHPAAVSQDDDQSVASKVSTASKAIPFDEPIHEQSIV